LENGSFETISSCDLVNEHSSIHEKNSLFVVGLIAIRNPKSSPSGGTFGGKVDVEDGPGVDVGAGDDEVDVVVVDDETTGDATGDDDNGVKRPSAKSRMNAFSSIFSLSYLSLSISSVSVLNNPLRNVPLPERLSRLL